MKKIVAALFAVIFIFNSFTLIHASETSVVLSEDQILLEAGFSTPEELVEAYNLAIENGDHERADELNAVADAYLDHLVDLLDLYLLRSARSYDDHQTMLRDYYYPYTSSSRWLNRDDGITLSIMPNLSNYTNFDRNKAWEGIYYVHRNDSKWDKTSSMKKQYLCHVTMWGIAKVPWNIEPWKSSTSSVTCN